MTNANNTYTILFSNMNYSTPYTNISLLQNQLILNNYGDLAIVERLTIFLTFIVSIIGIIGNAGTIIVLNQKTMRQWRSSILLTALAAVDLLYLSIIFLSIIDTLTNQAVGLHRSILLCQATVYITHVCSFLSAACTLSFTLQRFIAVHFPLHANAIISNRSSIITILSLVFISSSFYAFSFFVTNISQGQCREDESYPVLFPLLIVDICLTFVIPFIFILLCNVAIVYKLQSRKKFTQSFIDSTAKASCCQRATDGHNERQELYGSNSQRNISTDYIHLKRGEKKHNYKMSTQLDESQRSEHKYLSRLSYPRLSMGRSSCEYVAQIGTLQRHQQAISQRTTKMLVICSTTFLIFNSPYSAVLFYSIISKQVLTRPLDILRYFYFMSFCLNFFLYSLCGNRFRHELIILLKKVCHRCCMNIFPQHCLPLSKSSPHTADSISTIRTRI
ncbi:unnamed protein product [Rotaria socialis]|uniref:G-protein coupled receptors family 1 profile domain-containing protein n=2 Tax=Rotaria socialis TaxID=392032 RepID=A0A818DPR5_9BILA|nr:unnamed protein product [Rotaria socialis]CAF3450229.1 unnamed protein product [Rotaria socialis]CAF3524107.1 unnamed protein product [Rotaria socialis]CAF4168214.1 unnamed protein product [Rotaria socialis]CAF4226843.1 unnamed protein product [Rotaria socialis]